MSVAASDIIRAVMDGNVGILKKLLTDDPKLALTKDDDSRTPLHWATSFQNLAMVQMLLNPSQFSQEITQKRIVVDIDDYLDDSNWTPMHIAASTGNMDIFKVLASHEPAPDINLQTTTGQTCLHYAVSKNHPYVVEYLLKELKANARIKDKKGQLPLHRAAALGSLKIVQLLVDIGKSPLNVTDSFGMTAIHHGLAEGHGDVALQLVKYGADWQKETADGQDTVQVALNDNVREFFKKGLIAEGLIQE